MDFNFNERSDLKTFQSSEDKDERDDEEYFEARAVIFSPSVTLEPAGAR